MRRGEAGPGGEGRDAGARGRAEPGDRSPLASRRLSILIRALLALGLVAQVWLLYELRHDFSLFGSLGELTLYFIPFLLAFAGAGLALWLQGRGSGWVWLAAGLPAVLLVLGLALAVLLTIHPIGLHQA